MLEIEAQNDSVQDEDSQNEPTSEYEIDLTGTTKVALPMTNSFVADITIGPFITIDFPRCLVHFNYNNTSKI